jgi:arylsulfatase A-like enzyme
VAGPGKPQFMAEYRKAYGWDGLTLEHVHEIMATYHGMVSRVDDQLARLLRAVDAIGATDDTVVAAFTDHGEYLGDFGLVEKWPSGLDPCLLRNPLVLAGAGLPEGVTVDQPVEMVDLLATLCELAEAPVAHTHFGRSLLPVLRDAERLHRPFACAEGGFRVTDVELFESAGWIYAPKAQLQHDRPELVGTAMVLRTPDHTYVHRRYEGDELYDRRADPAEEDNVIDRPDSGDIAASLRGQLLGWLADTSDVTPWQADPRGPEIPHGWR